MNHWKTAGAYIDDIEMWQELELGRQQQEGQLGGRTSNLRLGKEGLEWGYFVMCVGRNGRVMGRKGWCGRQGMEWLEMHLNAACRGIDLLSKTPKFNGLKSKMSIGCRE